MKKYSKIIALGNNDYIAKKGTSKRKGEFNTVYKILFKYKKSLNF